MRYVKVWALAALLVFSFFVQAQKNCDEIDSERVDRLKEHIGFLASDELQGRKPGTEGAEKAVKYITERFKLYGLTPVEGKRYQQRFVIPTEVKFDSDNLMVVGNKELKLMQDFYPSKYSTNGKVIGESLYVGYGITAPEKKHDDYSGVNTEKAKGKVFVIDISSPDGIHPHSEYLKYHDIGDRVRLAKEKGAAAVILINLKGTANDLSPEFNKIHSTGIPVIFVTNNDWAKKLKRKKEIELVTKLTPTEVGATNVVGYVDNEADQTIIIGAHYDHLGYGSKNSLYKGEPAIHNGADDNASGVAGLLELAREISSEKGPYERSNFLFIAFSGEEMGLLGSIYFAEHMEEIEIVNPSYMLNMDMIGRLEDKTLAVNGVGTSPAWEEILRSITCDAFEVKTSKSGVGPSDHTSFYYLDMPVLHFFTGTHSDYHKPTDDADKINYEGEAMVINYILNVIAYSFDFEKIEFTPTKEQSAMAPKFSVTLGVMPDYMYDGEGMRIDGVTEDKAAANAGLQKGDIVTLLGEVKVVDMMSYMKALGQFKKGDSAPIEYLREGKKQKGTVKF